jgi:hypothetical protein
MGERKMDESLRKRRKAAYDKKYRKRNWKRIQARHAAYFQRTYDPVQAAKERKKRMPYHVKYCRQPWYRAWKREYDRRRCAGRFGAFAGAYKALLELLKEVRKQMPDRFERYAQSGRKQWSPINQERYRRKNYERRNESFGG